LIGKKKTNKKKTKASGIGIKPRGNLQRKYEKNKKENCKVV